MRIETIAGAALTACIGFSSPGCAFDASGPQGGDDGEDMPPADTEAGDTGMQQDTGNDDGDEETGEPDDLPPGPWDDGWPIPAFEQVPGDPDAGRWALLNEGYVSCGIPYSLFTVATPFLGERAEGETLPDRDGLNAEMPYDWTVHQEDGVDIASPNCLECHAGYWNGELVIGLGRADADYTEALGDMLAGIDIPKLPIPGIEQLIKFVDRAAVVAPFAKMRTIGSNPADMFGVVLASHRDPETLAWIDEPLSALPEIPMPIDTPPWWRLKKKNGLFYNGMARGDHRGTMMFASSLCTDTVDEMQSILSYFNNINAYLRSLEAPKYPFAIDDALAADGEELFGAYCAGCHGTYGETDADDTYPNLLFPLPVVGTDPLMANGSAMLPEFVDWWYDSPYGATTEIQPAEPFAGYTAPPLDGIWATAPFLHNGSVPTLDLVLDSKARPTYWRRVDYDSKNFDEERIGWPFVELDHGQEGLDPAEAKHIYDSTQLGHWNTGHTFGDHLGPEERRAVIEYLKTL